jgi:hypothetical protein
LVYVRNEYQYLSSPTDFVVAQVAPTKEQELLRAAAAALKVILLEPGRSVSCWKVKVLIQNECLCELVVRDAFHARPS